MRNGVLSGVFLIILFLGGLGLVLSDGGGFFRDGIGSTNIATIGSNDIHIAEFDRSLRVALRQQGVSTQDAYKAGLIHQFLAQELNRAALRQEAHDIGIELSDKELASAIAQIINPLMASGMSKQDAFNRMLQVSNMSEKDFLQEIREDKTSQILFDVISQATPQPSEALAEALTQYQTHNRKIAFVNFPNNDVSGVKSPSDDELAKYYESVKSRYMTDELRDLSLLVIDAQRLEDTVVISDEQIKTFYDDNVSQFQNPERRELHQAIFKDELSAKKAAEQFKGDLKSTVVNITGNEDAFVGVQTFTQDELLTEIADDVFDAANEDVVGPVKTALGWHVFQVTAILKPEVTALEDVSDEIKATLKQEQMAEDLYTLADEMDERLVEGEKISVLVEQLPIKEIKLDNMTRYDGTRLSKLSEEDQNQVVEGAFAIYEGENTPIEQLSDGRFFSVYVHSVTPSVLPEINDVKTELTNEWIKTKQQMKNFVDANKALTQIQSGDKDISTLSPQITIMSNSDEAPFGLTSHSLNTFFTAQKGDTKIVTTPNGIVMGQVQDIVIPDTDKLDAGKLANAKDALNAQAEQEMLSAYINVLQTERHAKVNEPLLTKFYGEQSQY